jgi:hypothetical protein
MDDWTMRPKTFGMDVVMPKSRAFLSPVCDVSTRRLGRSKIIPLPVSYSPSKNGVVAKGLKTIKRLWHKNNIIKVDFILKQKKINSYYRVLEWKQDVSPFSTEYSYHFWKSSNSNEGWTEDKQETINLAKELNHIHRNFHEKTGHKGYFVEVFDGETGERQILAAHERSEL